MDKRQARFNDNSGLILMDDIRWGAQAGQERVRGFQVLWMIDSDRQT